MHEGMSPTRRLRPDSLLTISLWLAVLVAPVRTGESDAKTQDVAPNPHRDSGLCSLCHTSDAGGRDALRFGGNVSQLCQSCHDGRQATREAHVVDIRPSPKLAGKIPSDFPLAGGTLTCLSCHDMAQSCRTERQPASSGQALLRGGRTPDPLLFCFRCHAQEDYRPFNPHEQLEANRPKTETCLWCHVDAPAVDAPPREGVAPGLRAKTAALCRNCHVVAQSHPVAGHMDATPSADMVQYMSAYEMKSKMRLPFGQLLEIARATKRTPRSIPLDETGRITCVSCHNPHEKGLLPGGNPRAVGAEPKQATNHRLRIPQGSMCVACHQK
jgi:hypothetical protein